MEDIQPKKTSNVDATIGDFITIRDLLKDSNRYFQTRIESKTDTNTYEDYDNLEYLYERSTDVLQVVNDIIAKSNKEVQQTTFEPKIDDNGESEENTSYLDMTMRKYNGYELAKPTESLNRNDYVDVVGKSSKECIDDDNIYDNYMVERNAKGITSELVPKSSVNGHLDCPFNGLPATHLSIMHSPKMGWLTMHLRRKRFLHRFSMNFKRKYYAGLVLKQTLDKDHCEWWLLMYAGGTSDLKPTICLPLNQFEASLGHTTKNDDKQQVETKRNPCKFELNEKSTKKDAKSYCFIAETPEHCEHWINLLKPLSNGLPYIENAFTTIAQIRKLPMLPLNAKCTNNDRLNEGTVDTTAISKRSNGTVDVCNYSEGVYEEPEEYYKNVPKLPRKKISQSPPTPTRIQTIDISLIYDTPKKSIRKTDETKNYDLISVRNNDDNDNTNEPKTLTDATHEYHRLKIDDEIRSKLSTQLKEQSQKYLSSSGGRSSDEDMIRNSTISTTSTTTDGIPNKYQLSAMRKWLFSNHLAKLRQSTNSTNFMRKSSGNNISETITQPKFNQQQTQSAIGSSAETQKRAFSVQPKGTKVHRIINQLEANGQLTLLTSSNKCSASMSA